MLDVVAPDHNEAPISINACLIAYAKARYAQAWICSWVLSNHPISRKITPIRTNILRVAKAICRADSCAQNPDITSPEYNLAHNVSPKIEALSRLWDRMIVNRGRKGPSACAMGCHSSAEKLLKPGTAVRIRTIF